MIPNESGEVRFKWNVPQTKFLLTRAQRGGPIVYLDNEGAVRAGKSTPAAAKLCMYVRECPGIQMAACRWSQDALDAQVRPLWRDMAKRFGLTLKWHADEEYDEVVGTEGPGGTPSRVYLRALKASDDANRYSKLAGLTLAVVWIDQPEEVPEDVFMAYVPARLSQPGYPHECWLTPNPPGESHWLAQKFPLEGIAANHHYIRTSVYDNRENLGEAYIADLEAAYPPGTALRRRFIDGQRGLAAVGEPVYKGYFARRQHERDIRFNRDAPLYEAWDFGHHHPAVCWIQLLPGGCLAILGGVMGESLFLEDFVPEVVAIRSQWCPNPIEVLTTGDPAGTALSSQGTNKSAADVLKAYDIHLRVISGANHPNARHAAIQTMAAYMRRMTPSGPALAVNPRFWIISKTARRMSPVLVDGLEAGYVWDDAPAQTGAIRKPKKDGFYDHGMNCFAGDTLIRTATGIARIDSIVGVPTRVLTVNGYWADTDGSFLTRRHAKTVLVRFGDGTGVVCTPDHRFYVKDQTGRGSVWMEAQYLAGCRCVVSIPEARIHASMVCKSVEPWRPRSVYCLNVPGYNAFALWNGIIVHNCLEYALLKWAPRTSELASVGFGMNADKAAGSGPIDPPQPHGWML